MIPRITLANHQVRYGAYIYISGDKQWQKIPNQNHKLFTTPIHVYIWRIRTTIQHAQCTNVAHVLPLTMRFYHMLKELLQTQFSTFYNIYEI